MQPTQHATALGSATQEVLLRTLASDLAAVKQGSTTPVPEHLIAQTTNTNASPEQATAKKSAGNALKLLLALLFLAAIGVGFYFFVYPSLTQVMPE